VDAFFLPTLGIQILQGRNFSKEHGNDAGNSVIINETAVKKYNWDDPIGKIIQTANTDVLQEMQYVNRTVIGVVKDFHLSSVSSEILPIYIGNDLDYPFSFGKIQALATRIQPDDVQATLSKMEAHWKAIFPEKEFNYYFLDEDFNEQFISIERSRDILSYLTFLAIFISCLGLFGMVAYSAEKRTKEIGIRKTLGSSVTQIVTLLSKELLVLVFLANVLAWPIAYFSISRWLNDFPYRMDISIFTFLFSTLLALLISLLTISIQSVKAANANPVEALHYE